MEKILLSYLDLKYKNIGLIDHVVKFNIQAISHKFMYENKCICSVYYTCGMMYFHASDEVYLDLTTWFKIRSTAINELLLKWMLMKLPNSSILKKCLE